MKTLPILAALALTLSACSNPTDPHAATATQHGDAHTDTHEHGQQEAGHDAAGHAPDSTVIPEATAQRAGIRVQAAGPGVIADQHVVQGLLAPITHRVARVEARFPGPIRSLQVQVGDTVEAGQPVATIHSNLSLSTYTVRAPISGTVTSLTASVGGMAGQGTTLMQIADLSKLWVDLHIFGSDAGHIQPGAAVRVTRLSDGLSTETTLQQVLPGMATASQSTIARAVIENKDGRWRPGAAVRARITVAEQAAQLVVPRDAVQTMEGRTVVFVRQGNRYLARPVELGAQDADHVAVTAGLEAGEQVVVAESYLVKADILKQSASHEH